MLALTVLVGCAGGRANSPSTPAICPPGAALRAGQCACRGDLALLAGACVSPRVLANHCGPGAAATANGCVSRPSCERGRARDIDAGECLARREVRAIAVSLGMRVADDEVLVCPSGAELLYADGDARGAPPLLVCSSVAPPGAAAPCPAGAIASGAHGCAAILAPGRSSNELQVDVVAWVRAAIGPEGGAGAPLLCDALGRRAGALAPAAAETRLVVSLVFPDNDVSQVSSDVRALGDAGGSDPVATVELGRVVGPLVEALRSFGGTASQATVTTRVTCGQKRGQIGQSRPPEAVPENDVGR